MLQCFFSHPKLFKKVFKIYLEPFSKKCDIRCHIGTRKQKWKTSWMLWKPRWCWHILRHFRLLIHIVRPFCYTKNVSIFSCFCATNEILCAYKNNSSILRFIIILDINLFTVKNNDFWLKLVHGCIILFYILMRLQRVYVPSYLVTYVT